MSGRYVSSVLRGFQALWDPASLKASVTSACRSVSGWPAFPIAGRASTGSPQCAVAPRATPREPRELVCEVRAADRGSAQEALPG